MYPKPLIIASVNNIKDAWKDSRDSSGKGGARGIDGITPTKYRENLETNITRLRAKLIEGNYSFRGLKPHFIQKGNGEFRVICVPAVEDRLLQRVILKRLCEGKRDRLSVLSPVSFGIKKGTDQGVHEAIATALQLRQKHNWVLKTDISKFFDNIPRDFLKQKVRARLGKSSLVPLIDQAIDCEVITENSNEQDDVEACGIINGKGLRQGMPLSPLLSNLVLNGLDRRAKAKGFNLIRYADDIIVFCDSEDECKSIFAFIEKEVKKLSLSVPSISEQGSKTEILKPDDPVIFLGVEIYPGKKGKYEKRIPDDTKRRARDKIKIHANLDWNIVENYDYPRVLQRLKDIPDGYKSAFKGCTNLKSFLDVLEQDALIVKQSLLEEIFGEEVLARLSPEQRQFMNFPF